MKNLIALFIAIVFMFSASLAQAEVVSFGDNVNYWEGFGNRYDDRYDVIGNPDITGGNFVFSDHVLTGVSINYNTTNKLLIPGDWFFDVDQDNNWDYVLHNNIPSYKEVGPYDSSNSYSLYSVDFDFAIDSPLASWRKSSPYDESFARWYDSYREDHPVQANVDSSKYDFTLLQTISFTGWEYTGTGPYTATWSGFELDLTEFLGKEFTYGFAMTCANDVLFGSAPIPSPEPSTWILFGSGLGMLMLARRKRKDNSA